MQEYTHTFSVRLNDKQSKELTAFLNSKVVLNCRSKSDRFRKLLDDLAKDRSGSVAPGPVRNSVNKASSVVSCDFSKVMIGHREWLVQHFPGNRELQLKVAELLAGYDPNSSYDWEAAIKELRE